MATDLVLFPHCDLHIALDQGPLSVTVFLRTNPAYNQPYNLAPVAATFDFYSPYAPAADRFTNVPTVQNGQIVATTQGIFLFQCTYQSATETHSIVGRLQVHQRITDWWFGNDSITTALDAAVAHAQPTIYAEFGNDNAAAGTDLVGDITGHGYVTLSFADSSKVEVVNADNRGRLRGIAETGAQPAILDGKYRGGMPRELQVRVVDYAKRREILEPVVGSPVARAANLLFLGEGFSDSNADRKLFDDTIKAVYEGMFTKPRHQPFPMLKLSVSAYKAFTPSTQDLLTCGFRVVDQPPPILPKIKGAPIPWKDAIGGVAANFYTVQLLVHKVGLPKREETRAVNVLKNEWSGQNLDNFNAGKVHDDVVETWRRQHSKGLLQARDTFLGLHLGQRLADGISDPRTVLKPGPNPTPDQVKAFVRRLYSFYAIRPAHTCKLDPRRHPPELYQDGLDNPLTSLTRLIGGLAEMEAPKRNLGTGWTPDNSFLKRSRGLVFVVVKDFMYGGTNIENGVACFSLDRQHKLGFTYGGPPSANVMRRDPSPVIKPDTEKVTDLAVHELGHSFNLEDEYELVDVPPSHSTVSADNIATLDDIRKGSTGKRFDPDKVKWLGVRRIKLASRVMQGAKLLNGPRRISVVVPAVDIPLWQHAKAEPEIFLCRHPNSTGRQLPFSETNGRLLLGLKIHTIRPTLATIELIIPSVGPQPDPDLLPSAGSVLFVPARDSKGIILRLAEQRVLELFRTDPSGALPLNQNPSTVPSNAPDVPRTIAKFTPSKPESYTVGVYEGAGKSSVDAYRPAGACKLRNQDQPGDLEGAFCFVCKWLIVNRLDPAKHHDLEKTYRSGTTHA